MAVIIRLARHGAKKKPFYRVVAADTRFPRDGRFLEILGTYDPRDKVAGLKLDVDAVRGWKEKGAQISDAVLKLVRKSAPAATTEPTRQASE
jgi:small subunit ribosomal protein S16